MFTGAAPGRQPAAESAHRVAERPNLPPEPPPPGQHHRSVSTQYRHSINYLCSIYSALTTLTGHAAPPSQLELGLTFHSMMLIPHSLTPAPPRYLGNLVSSVKYLVSSVKYL